MTDSWYKYRIVKHRLLPGVTLAADPRVAEARDSLLRQAEGDVAVYLRSHKLAQMMETEFVHQEADGLRVFVAVTFFGPPEMKTEILEELAKKGDL